MIGFELQISGIVNDHSANCAPSDECSKHQQPRLFIIFHNQAAIFFPTSAAKNSNE